MYAKAVAVVPPAGAPVKVINGTVEYPVPPEVIVTIPIAPSDIDVVAAILHLHHQLYRSLVLDL